MFECGVGHSDDVDEQDAVAAACQLADEQLTRPPVGALLFCGVGYDLQAVLDAFVARYPGVPVVGGTTDGELSHQLGYTEESVLVALFASDNVTFQSAQAANLSGREPEATAEVAAALHDNPTLVFVVADGLTSGGDAILRGLQDSLGADVPILGGLAGDKLALTATYQFCDGKVLTNAVVALSLEGPLQLGIGAASGWHPIGNPGTVTEAEGKVVRSIDGRPTMAWYERYAGGGLDNTWMHAYPLAVWHRDGRTFHIRSPVTNTPDDGAVQFSGDVPAGAKVQIAEAGRGRILEGSQASTRSALADHGGTPTVAFVVSCTSRHLLLGADIGQEVASVRANLPKDTPVFGLYAYGEYGPMRCGTPTVFHNQSCVVLLMSAP